MQPTRSTGHVPPGFARVLKPGEVPLMAGSLHNRSTEAPPSKTTRYKMLLSTAASSVKRGYHALRFKRLQQVHGRKQLQRMCILSALGLLGLLLLFWEQVTWPLLIQLHQLEQHHLRSLRTVTSLAGGLEASEEDMRRCASVGLGVKIFIDNNEVQQLDPGRRALLQEAREPLREALPSSKNSFEEEAAGESGSEALEEGEAKLGKGLANGGLWTWLGASMAGSSGLASGEGRLHSLTPEQEEMAMGFFEMVTTAFRVVGLPFCLGGSSLAGSLLFHAPLPWVSHFHVLAPKTSRSDLLKVCTLLRASPDMAAARAYRPTRLLRWLSESGMQIQLKGKPSVCAVYVQCEETHAPYFYGRVWLDTKKAAEDLRLPPLEVKIFWYDSVGAAASEGAEGEGSKKEEAAVVVSPPKRTSDGGFTAPLSALSPFTERPFGLLLLPAPANPTFIFNRTYRRAKPFCMNRARRGWVAGDACRSAGREYVEVVRRPVTEECVREDLFVRGILRQTVYVKEKSAPAPEFASWLR